MEDSRERVDSTGPATATEGEAVPSGPDEGAPALAHLLVLVPGLIAVLSLLVLTLYTLSYGIHRSRARLGIEAQPSAHIHDLIVYITAASTVLTLMAGLVVIALVPKARANVLPVVVRSSCSRRSRSCRCRFWGVVQTFPATCAITARR